MKLLSKALVLFNVSLFTVIALSSCTDNENDDTPNPVSKTEYVFEREGTSSVSYEDQTAQLDQLSEIKTKLSKANDGKTKLDNAALKEMFDAENLKSSTKSDKASFYTSQLDEIAEKSGASTPAKKGEAGLIERKGKEKDILVDANGHEYVQVFEKGLMGATFAYQIFKLLSADSLKAGNETVVDGQNYTALEHNWDQAFGYFGVPTDFPKTKSKRFWGAYTDGRDELLGTSSTLMDAFVKGREAIVNKDQAVIKAQATIIKETMRKVASATAIHYFNSAKKAIAGGDNGEAYHTLSEGVTFLESLVYMSDTPNAAIEKAKKLIGGSFWDIDAMKLNSAIDDLATAYGHEAIKADL